MVGAADLDDMLPAGGDPRDSERGHDGLGAGAQHAEHLDVRHVPVDLAGNHQLGLMKQPCHGAALVQKRDHLLPDNGIVAAENSRAAGLQKIDVAIAVLVKKVRSLRARHAHRKGFVEGQVVLDAARNDLSCLLIRRA